MGMSYSATKAAHLSALSGLDPVVSAALADYVASPDRFAFSPTFTLHGWAPASVAAEVLIDPALGPAYSWSQPLLLRLRKGADVWITVTATYSGVTDGGSFRHFLNGVYATITPAFKAAWAEYCALSAPVIATLPVEQGSSAFYTGTPEPAPAFAFASGHAVSCSVQLTSVRLDAAFYPTVDDGLMLEGLLPAAKRIGADAAEGVAVGDVVLAADEWAIELVTPLGVYAGPNLSIEMGNWSTNANFYSRFNHSDAVEERARMEDLMRVLLSSSGSGGSSSACDGAPTVAQAALAVELAAAGVPPLDFSDPEKGQLFCSEPDRHVTT